MRYAVYENDKLAQYPDYEVHPSWTGADQFTSYEDAEDYALKWLGPYGPGRGTLVLDEPYYYYYSNEEGGDYVVIKEIQTPEDSTYEGNKAIMARNSPILLLQRELDFLIDIYSRGRTSYYNSKHHEPTITRHTLDELSIKINLLRMLIRSLIGEPLQGWENIV